MPSHLVTIGDPHIPATNVQSASSSAFITPMWLVLHLAATSKVPAAAFLCFSVTALDSYGSSCGSAPALNGATNQVQFNL